MAKQVYLVRHAESEANTGGEYKGEHTLLSEGGKTQARQVAERFKNILFDAVITSQFGRAIETGKSIAGLSQKALIEPINLFGERQHPPEAIGLRTDSPEYKKIRDETWQRFSALDLSHKGEETFPLLMERAGKAVKYLESRPENSLVVVSHANFTRFLVAYMCWGETLTPDIFLKFLAFTKLSNTGITHLVFDNETWTLHQWNDKAHLG